MLFDPNRYGDDVARLLAMGGGGARTMPLAIAGCTSEAAHKVLRSANAAGWFPRSFAPEAALSGLWLYFGCFEESHSVSQEIGSTEGSYWHGILHRQEPDAGNAAYWFRRVGCHPVFEPLRIAAEEIVGNRTARFPGGAREWDPFAFIDYCEYARRRPGSEDDKVATEVQLAEWQLLFDYCARPVR